jgi:hypothetical protein
MAGSLKVTSIDSPLRGLRVREEDAPPSLAPSVPVENTGKTVAVATEPAAPARRRTAARERGPAPTDPSHTQSPSLAPLWEPPPLSERAELVSTRLPASLTRALELHTRALRDRHATPSQKGLPMQEVLAAIVWAVGDPEDETAAERLDGIYRSYRARRMAAAAQALDPGSEAPSTRGDW